MANKSRQTAETKRVQGDEARTDTMTTKKRKRIPVHGLYRNVLTFNNLDPKYHYCMVSDIDNRLQEYHDAGYEFVNHAVSIGDDLVHADQEGRISKRVGKLSDGSPEIGYLMRIDKKFYEEDMAEFDRSVDESEADMYRALNDGKDGKYGKVEIGQSGRRR